MVGTVLFAVAVKRLSYALSWSFILAVLGFIVNFAAGVLMCVGRNISTKTKKKKRKKKPHNQQRGRVNRTEEVQMEETRTTRKNVWTSEDGPEVNPPEYTMKKKPLPGPS